MDLIAAYGDDDDDNNNQSNDPNNTSSNVIQNNIIENKSSFLSDNHKNEPKKIETEKKVFKLNLPPPKKITTVEMKPNTMLEEEEDEDDIKAKRFKMERENLNKPKSSFIDMLPKPKNPFNSQKEEVKIAPKKEIQKATIEDENDEEDQGNDKEEEEEGEEEEEVEEEEEKIEESNNDQVEDVGPSIPNNNNSTWDWYQEVNEEEPVHGDISDKYNPLEYGISNKAQFKEIKQNELVDKSYVERVYGQEYNKYFNKSNPYSMPSVTAKKRHQISSLAFEHHAKSQLMDERKSRAIQTKKEVKRKYGWK